MVDAANAHARRARSQTPGGSLPPLLPGQVYCKNTTGATRKRYEVLAISALSTATLAKSNPVTSAHNLRAAPVVIGVTPVPDTEVHHQRIAVLDAPAVDDAIVPAWVSGVCVARITYTGAAGEACEIGINHTLVNKPSGPVKLLALGETSAERLALVDLAPWGTLREVIVEIEATATQIRYKTQEVRVGGEKPVSDWIELLAIEDC